ncbi:hypothetical protein LTR49_027013 [Elasticomyces elasticus]|nr:hypothetical protein LTR49_027013 [Elasticomyces elasticus]
MYYAPGSYRHTSVQGKLRTSHATDDRNRRAAFQRRDPGAHQIEVLLPQHAEADLNVDSLSPGRGVAIHAARLDSGVSNANGSGDWLDEKRQRKLTARTTGSNQEKPLVKAGADEDYSHVTLGVTSDSGGPAIHIDFLETSVSGDYGTLVAKIQIVPSSTTDPTIICHLIATHTAK